MKSGDRAAEPERAARRRLTALLTGTRAEWWSRVALSLLVLFALEMLYLGLRPGGRGPILVFVQGRLWTGLLAFAVFSWGVVVALRRRPFFQRGRLRAFAALALVGGVANFPFPYPSSHENHPSTVEFHLPFEGEWRVYWGGREVFQNPLAIVYPDRRFGLHLVVDEEGRTHVGDGSRAADYLAFDRPVLAPAAGEVVRVRDGGLDLLPGRPPAGGGSLGNHVAIRVAEGEFVFLSNLRQGSIEVREGEAVERGHPLGRVGSSGLSRLTPEPHLALHLQDSPEPRWGEGIPWSFQHYLADGRPVERGQPTGGVARDGRLLGQRVRPGGE